MKSQKSITLFFLAVAFTLAVNTISAQSAVRQAIKEYKSSLYPFKYDSYATNKIVFDPLKPQLVEVEFTVFVKNYYKLIICTSGFSEQIKVNIYDKSKQFKKRKKLYDSEDGSDNMLWSYELSTMGTYYIDYEIPPSMDKKRKEGYIVMLIGNKNGGNNNAVTRR